MNKFYDEALRSYLKCKGAIWRRLMLKTTTETAKRLGVSRRTMIHWIHHQGLPAYRVGRVWRIDDYELQRWLEARRNDYGKRT